MRTTNKQAMKAKNSNLYAHITDILVALSAIVIGSLLLIYAPDILMAIGKFLACVALVAMVVVPAIYAFTWKPSKPYEKY
jgi:membrane protein YdbS with pleckstrin-like domain